MVAVNNVGSWSWGHFFYCFTPPAVISVHAAACSYSRSQFITRQHLLGYEALSNLNGMLKITAGGGKVTRISGISPTHHACREGRAVRSISQFSVGKGFANQVERSSKRGENGLS